MIPGAHVRVFRQTLYKVLVDEEVWSQHSTDKISNMVSPNNKYFLLVDLFKGYWPVQIAENDHHKKVFNDIWMQTL